MVEFIPCRRIHWCFASGMNSFVSLPVKGKGMWHSGSASALHAESPGLDTQHLHAVFESSRVRLTLGAMYEHSSVVERSIAEKRFVCSCADNISFAHTSLLALSGTTYV